MAVLEAGTSWKWLPFSPKNSQQPVQLTQADRYVPAATRIQLDQSPPSELPELVYPSPNDTTPSCSSEGHLEGAYTKPSTKKWRKNSPVARRPSLSFVPSFVADDPPSFTNFPFDFSNSPVMVRSSSSPSFSQRSPSSHETERMTVYSRTSQVPLISGRRVTITGNSRKLIKSRPPLVRPPSSYQIIDHNPISPVQLAIDQPKPKSTFASRILRWKSQSTPSLPDITPQPPVPKKLVKKHVSRRMSQPQPRQPDHFELPPVPLSPLALGIYQNPYHVRASTWLESTSPPASLHGTYSSTAAISELALNGIILNSRRDQSAHNSRSSSIDETFSSPKPGTLRQKIFSLGDPSEVLPQTAELDEKCRPPLIRRNALGSSPPPRSSTRPPSTKGTERRRWSLAMAMSDQGLTDEVFVQELERIRNEWDGSLDDADDYESDSDDDPNGRYQIADSAFHFRKSFSANNSSTALHSVSAHGDPDWPGALRAMLITRDLLRTEQNYLDSLHALLNSCPCPIPADFTLARPVTRLAFPWPKNPPPEIMLNRLLELIRTSTALLQRMQEDPSVWGIASAFVLVEDDLNKSFVAWCTGVGAWYEDKEVHTRRRLSKTRLVSPTSWEDKDYPRRQESDPGHESVDTTFSSLSRVSRSASGIAKSGSATSSPTFSTFKQRVDFGSKSRKSKQTVLNARELGILPVQRITRYTLLYRDLLAHTPSSSPARALLEQALEVARKIANNCDNAQRNVAFVWSPKP
ncbi:hypothetical protein C8J56DRAFT_317834 [Mycena floridula]|nr:hypothetical protein C8J56DRAFT_317834 [Mycena floridula]